MTSGKTASTQDTQEEKKDTQVHCCVLGANCKRPLLRGGVHAGTCTDSSILVVAGLFNCITMNSIKLVPIKQNPVSRAG